MRASMVGLNDSTLPLQGAQVRSLVGEVSHATRCGKKKKKVINKKQGANFMKHE